MTARPETLTRTSFKREERMRKLSILAAVLVFTSAQPISVQAYVPADPAMVRFQRAMDDWTPFIGNWEGKEALEGRPPRILHRRAWRAPGGDVLLELGYPFYEETTAVLTFDMDSQTYKLLLSGRLHTSACTPNVQIIDVAHPAPLTFQWVELGRGTQCGKTSMTITVTTGKWVENFVYTRPDGSSNSYETTLTRVP